MSRLDVGGVIAVALLLAPAVHAACTGGSCADSAAVASVRASVATACDCPGAGSHKEYTRCAKQMIRDAVAQGTLPRACKKAVGRCEAQSTCGLANAVVCCSVKNGSPRPRIMKRGGRCRGTSCDGPMAMADACTPEGTCAVSVLPPTTTLPPPTTTLPSVTTTTVAPATTTTLPPPARGPFRSVQQVFQTSCALPSCHSVFARQGGLVLESEELSYDSLVERLSLQAEARQENLLRVKSGDPSSSFLIRKLRGQGPGDAMPVGVSRLPESIIVMIEDWIRRGAHSTAEECPAAVTEGDPLTRPQPQHAGEVHTVCDPPPPPVDFVWQPLPALEAPAPGTGIQLYMPPRDVAPGTEWETCYAFRPDWAQLRAQVGVPDGQALTFKQQIYRMHEGSHHLLLYAYFGNEPEKWKLGEYFPCFAGTPQNRADGPSDPGTSIPIGGTQVAGTRYEVTYPQGVGIPVLNGNQVMIANLHYTNPFQPAQPIYGEAWLNLSFHTPGEFKALLDGIFAINFSDLFVEPFTSRTISRIWQPRGLLTGASTDAAVFQLFGHMHKRGVEFRIDKVRDGKCSASQALCGRDEDCACRLGQRNCTPNQTCVRGPVHEDSTIYYTTRWDHAPVVDFPKPYLSVKKDEGLRWTCTHTNGIEGDPTRPPKRCTRECNACGWDDATGRCVLDPRPQLGSGAAIRYYTEGDPMPLVFGELADDDMCNMFGYFITQADADRLP